MKEREENWKTDRSGALYLVPKDYLDKLQEKISSIFELLNNQQEKPARFGDYIYEREACKILGYKPTWFWMMRTSGRLPYTKVGNKVYYKKQDIENLMEKNRRDAIPESRLIKETKKPE